MFKSKSLSIKLIAPLYISIPVIFLGLSLSYIWNTQSRDAVDRISGDNISQIHALVQNEINEIVAIPARIAKINKTLFEEGHLDPNDFETWEKIFKEEFRTFEWISSIVWGDANGRALWIGQYADGNIYWAIKENPKSDSMLEWQLDQEGNRIAESENSFKYNLYSRPWFIGPKESGRPQWTKPFIWAGGESSSATVGISYGIPIYDDKDTFIGIIDTDISLNDLSSYLQTIKIGKTGIALIVTNEGKIIASSNAINNINPDGTIATLAETNSQLASAANTFLSENVLSDQIDDLIRGKFQIDNDSISISSSRVGESVGLQWNIITLVPDSDFLDDIDKSFFNSTLISSIAVFLSILLGLIASHWLIMPLLKLTKFTNSIRTGSVDNTIDLKHTSEYEELADSINLMVKKLNSSIKQQEKLAEDLDGRVVTLEELKSRLRAIIDSTLNSIITINSQSEVVEMNQIAEAMFGYTKEEAVGQNISDLIIPAEYRDAHNAGMNHYLKTGVGPILNKAIEVPAIKKNGDEFFIKLEIVPFIIEDEYFFTATIQDISLEKKQEVEIKESREHEVLLNRELDHRVKNMLAQIISICRQATDKSTTDTTILEDLTMRVTGIASIHEMLATSSHASINLKVLIDACCKPYATDAHHRIGINGPEITLNSKAVLCLGMVFNELANNSLKYGSLADPAGKIKINWDIEESENQKTLEFNWVEQHTAELPESIDGGLGSKIIRLAIPHELEGTAEITVIENGIHFKASIPVESIRVN
jgi:PAS domain S-box-containing protein